MDDLEGDAARSGAVNIVINRNWLLIGGNTDTAGAKHLLKSLVGPVED